ncbi:MAG: hypothetical protein U1E85_06785 [Rhodocyclaceae bacterium]
MSIEELQEALQLARTARRYRSSFNSIAQALREKAILKRLGAAEVRR